MGAGNILTRIGVNTGRMKVGNYGTLQKLNYTALGDEVNLASRLEGANKLYGSQILVAQSTVELSKNQFLFRRLDLLRVKGKKKPIAVHELMAEGAGDARQQQIVRNYWSRRSGSDISSRIGRKPSGLLVALLRSTLYAARWPDPDAAETRAGISRKLATDRLGWRAYREGQVTREWLCLKGVLPCLRGSRA